MSNLLSIPAALPVTGSGTITAGPSRNGAPQQTSPLPAAKPVPLFVNPNFHFDPSVGLVVIQFHDNTGTLTSSIPTQHQLNAYRLHQETPPNGKPPPATPAIDGETSTA